MIWYKLMNSETTLLNSQSVLSGTAPVAAVLSETITPLSETESNLKLTYQLSAASGPLAALEMVYHLRCDTGHTSVDEMECLAWHVMNHVEDWYLYDGISELTGASPLPDNDCRALAMRLYLHSEEVCHPA